MESLTNVVRFGPICREGYKIVFNFLLLNAFRRSRCCKERETERRRMCNVYRPSPAELVSEIVAVFVGIPFVRFKFCSNSCVQGLSGALRSCTRFYQIDVGSSHLKAPYFQLKVKTKTETFPLWVVEKATQQSFISALIALLSRICECRMLAIRRVNNVLAGACGRNPTARPNKKNLRCTCVGIRYFLMLISISTSGNMGNRFTE